MIGQKKKRRTSWRMSSTCLHSYFVGILLPVKFCFCLAEKKSKMSQPIRGQGGHLGFQIFPPPPPQKSIPSHLRRGSGLDCGSGDLVLIPGTPSPRLGPLMVRRLKTSWDARCPCRDRLCTLKTPNWPWRWVPGSRSEFGNWKTVPSLYSWNFAECDVKPQPTDQKTQTL